MRETNKRKRSAVDWSDGIPVEILSLIAQKIDSFTTCAAFAAVCRSWFNLIATYHITASTPWLMLSEQQNSPSRSFYRFGSSDQVFDIQFPSDMKGRRCWCSPFGWLITYKNKNGMSLYNPLSRASIPLPKLSKQYRQYRCLEKVILTASPDSPNCMVLIIPTMDDGDDLVYARPGDTAWSVIKYANLADVLSFRGSLYGCNLETGNIVTLEFETNFSSQYFILKEFADAPLQMTHRGEEVCNEYNRKKYLLDIGGEFYLVLRYVRAGHDKIIPDIQNYYLTYDFEIYKMDLSTKVWKLVESLENHCLFIGTHNAFGFSVSSADHQHETNGNGISLRPNCIYFLDDRAFDKQSDGSDMGVFHIGERQFGARPLGENVGILFEEYNEDIYHSPQPNMLKTLASTLYSSSCPPLWITPYLRLHKPSYNDHHHQIEAKDKKLSIIKVEPFTKMTPEVEDEQMNKLIIQLKNQFTYKEKRGVNRRPWREPL